MFRAESDRWFHPLFSPDDGQGGGGGDDSGDGNKDGDNQPPAMSAEDMKRLIQDKAKVVAIRSQAVKDGMMTLKQDGIEKVFAGNLDLLQVRKVCIK